MKLPRRANSPSDLVEFFEEGLSALGAVCERTWHDRLSLVAEGPAARLWDPDGRLLEKEIRFVPPDDAGPRQADSEVFPGCPLTFRLTETLRANPLPLEYGRLEPAQPVKAPTGEVAEKLWHAQIPGCSRWRLEGVLVIAWHFSLLALARCEIQAIDQHWSLHRVAISLADGQPDESLASSLDFLQLSPAAAGLPWPRPRPENWREALRRAFELELEPDLAPVRERQQKYLRRELERIDAYFEGYEKEIRERQRRAHTDGSRIKAEERLAAAKDEHVRRRQDQIHRHEIRVITHLDILLLLGEPAWQAKVSYLQKGEPTEAHAQFVPRCRRWVIVPG